MYATPYDKHFYDFLTDNSGKVCISQIFIRLQKMFINNLSLFIQGGENEKIRKNF